MSSDALLVQKLAAYRDLFEQACSRLFLGEGAITVDLDDDDDARSEPSFENSNRGSSSIASDLEAGAATKEALVRCLRAIADDFGREFNAKLAAAAKDDSSVAAVAPNYEMTAAHREELASGLAATIRPLLDKLDAGALAGARRATIDAWPLLERRITSKWQAYFVLTFQDVSVERKAARDRRRLQPRFGVQAAELAARAEAQLRAMPDFAPPVPPGGGGSRSPVVAVVALLVAATVAGWLVVRRARVAARTSPSVPATAR